MTTASESPAKPLPRIDGPEAPFWEGLREGEIRVQHCSACGRPRFPASRYCPKCHSGEFDWKPVTTEGDIESFCVFHKAYFPGFLKDMPYAVIQVKLDNGLRFFSNIVGAENHQLKTGMRVRAVFERATPEVTLLKFAPVGESK